MQATIHVLDPGSAPVAGFLRVGHTDQKKLEALCAAGPFPYRRAVFDAAYLPEQLKAVPFRGGGGAINAVLGH